MPDGLVEETRIRLFFPQPTPRNYYPNNPTLNDYLEDIQKPQRTHVFSGEHFRAYLIVVLPSEAKKQNQFLHFVKKLSLKIQSRVQRLTTEASSSKRQTNSVHEIDPRKDILQTYNIRNCDDKHSSESRHYLVHDNNYIIVLKIPADHSMDLVHEFSHILSVTVNVDQRYSGKHFFEDEEQKFAQFDLDPPLLPGIFDEKTSKYESHSFFGTVSKNIFISCPMKIQFKIIPTNSNHALISLDIENLGIDPKKREDVSHKRKLTLETRLDESTESSFDQNETPKHKLNNMTTTGTIKTTEKSEIESISLPFNNPIKGSPLAISDQDNHSNFGFEEKGAKFDDKITEENSSGSGSEEDDEEEEEARESKENKFLEVTKLDAMDTLLLTRRNASEVIDYWPLHLLNVQLEVTKTKESPSVSINVEDCFGVRSEQTCPVTILPGEKSCFAFSLTVLTNFIPKESIDYNDNYQFRLITTWKSNLPLIDPITYDFFHSFEIPTIFKQRIGSNILLSFSVGASVIKINEPFIANVQVVNRSNQYLNFCLQVSDSARQSQSSRRESKSDEDFFLSNLNSHVSRDAIVALDNFIELNPLEPNSSCFVRLRFVGLKTGFHDLPPIQLFDKQTSKEIVPTQDPLAIFISD